ncbi:MAG: recombination-associated protein RdgC [Planctomycetota bacterium]
MASADRTGGAVGNLRRGGSASLYFVDGDLPSLHSDGFVAALSNQRFRSIEAAASEEISIGWICADDPSGESFPIEHLDLERAVWLQVRIDKKKLPARWVAIYRSAAERAAGRKLNGKERKALKDDLMEKLLPRVLPTVQIVDVLFDHKSKRVLLFSTSKSARDEFASLFLKTFAGARLKPASAFEWALHCRITADQRRYLEEVAPVKWPSQNRDRHETSTPAPAPGDALEIEA